MTDEQDRLVTALAIQHDLVRVLHEEIQQKEVERDEAREALVLALGRAEMAEKRLSQYPVWDVIQADLDRKTKLAEDWEAIARNVAQALENANQTGIAVLANQMAAHGLTES